VTVSANPSAPTNENDDLLIQLQLDGGWPELEARSIARLVATSSKADAGPVSEREYIDQLARICLRLGFADLNALLDWVASVGWVPEHLAIAVSREAMFARAQTYWSHSVRAVALDLLYLDGRAGPLLTRSRLKRQWLESSAAGTGVDRHDPTEALTWYRKKIGVAPIGADELARLNGWSSESDMMDDVLCEYIYQQAQTLRE
jgi:TPR repeat protein